MGLATDIFTTAQLPTDFAKKSFAAMLTRFQPNGGATLFALSSLLKEETVISTTHGFWSKTMVFPSCQLNGAIADGTVTTFTVDSSAEMIPGMILRASTTFEQVIVNTVPNSTSITVSRGQGTTAAAAIADNVVLYKIGTAFEEGSTRPLSMNLTPVQLSNYTQIFRNSWVVSGTAAAVDVVVGEGNVAESKGECVNFHAMDIEMSIWFGEKLTGTRNGKPFRKMEGLIPAIRTLAYYPPSYASVNYTVAGATTTYAQLEAMLDPCFNQAMDGSLSNERVLFVGATANKVLNGIGRLYGDYQMLAGQTSFGLQYTTFKISRGQFRVIEHPMFSIDPAWSKMAVAVDLSSFNVGYLRGRKTQYKEFNMDGKEADDFGVDAMGGTLTTEMTCTIKNPPANAVITNLTAAA